MTDVRIKFAAEIFEISEDTVTPEQRRVAKELNFPCLYGDYTTGEDVGLTRETWALDKEHAAEMFARVLGNTTYEDKNADYHTISVTPVVPSIIPEEG